MPVRAITHPVDVKIRASRVASAQRLAGILIQKDVRDIAGISMKVHQLHAQVVAK